MFAERARRAMRLGVLSCALCVAPQLAHAACDSTGAFDLIGREIILCDGSDPNGFDGSGSSLNLLIEADATVDNDVSTGDGSLAVNLGTITNGALRVADDGVVDNAGSILDSGAVGVIGGDDVTLTNRASGTISGAQIGVILGDNASIDNGGAVSGIEFGFRLGAGATFVNRAGGVVGGGLGSGIRYGVDGGDGGSVTNEAGGSITGDVGAIRLGDRSAVDNAGEIQSIRSSGIEVGAQSRVTNRAGGQISSMDTVGVSAGGGSSVANSGQIRSDTTGVSIGSEGREFTDSAVLSNTAGGSIVGGDKDGVALYGPGTVDNAGSIEGGDTGVRFAGRNDLSEATVVNRAGGVIQGRVAAISSDTQLGPVTVENAGTLKTLRFVIFSFGDRFDPGAAFVLRNSGSVVNLQGADEQLFASESRIDVTNLPGGTFSGILNFASSGGSLAFRGPQTTQVRVDRLFELDPGGLTVFDGRDASGDGLIVVTDATALSSQAESFSDMIGAISGSLERRGGAGGFGGGAGPQTAALAPTEVPAAFGMLGGVDGAGRAPRGVWGEAFGGVRERDGDGVRFDDRTLSLGGFIAGADGRIGATRTAGLFAGVAYGRTESGDDRSTLRSTTGFLGATGSERLGPLRFDASVTGGFSQYDSDREVGAITGLETASAEFTGWFVAPELRASARIGGERFAFVPSATVGYAGLFTEGYEESGSTGLEVGDQTTHLFRGRVSFAAPYRFGQRFHYGLGIAPRIGVEATAYEGDEVDLTVIGLTESVDPLADDLEVRGFGGLTLGAFTPGGGGLFADVEADFDGEGGYGLIGRLSGRVTF